MSVELPADDESPKAVAADRPVYTRAVVVGSGAAGCCALEKFRKPAEGVAGRSADLIKRGVHRRRIVIEGRVAAERVRHGSAVIGKDSGAGIRGVGKGGVGAEREGLGTALIKKDAVARS